jgi:hypothetical protein
MPHTPWLFSTLETMALDKRPPTSTRSSNWIEVLQDFARVCTKVGFFKGMHVAIDDNVLRKRSKETRNYQVSQNNNPKKGMGIAHHACVSVTSGLYYAGHIQGEGENTADCVTVLQRILSKAAGEPSIDFDGTVFFIDRGYGGVNGDIMQQTLDRGGDIVGTSQRMASYPYTYG